MEMQLSLGPLQWLWRRNKVFSFYETAADWPVEIVCLGETVCARRREMKLPDWIDLGRDLRSAGKTVVLSTQVLIESEADLRALRRVCDNGEFPVEANDQSALELVTRNQWPFITGPAVNIYNAATLMFLQDQGLKRWCLPLELSRNTLASIQDESASKGCVVPVEVFAWGYMPLAWSARCFTARHHGKPKDQCEFVCKQYPTGLPLRSQETREVFTLNGIQTMSGTRYNLLSEMERMQQMGVAVVRLSPEDEGMAEVVRQFDRARRGEPEVTDPLAMRDATDCNGYWFGRPGMG